MNQASKGYFVIFAWKWSFVAWQPFIQMSSFQREGIAGNNFKTKASEQIMDNNDKCWIILCAAPMGIIYSKAIETLCPVWVCCFCCCLNMVFVSRMESFSSIFSFVCVSFFREFEMRIYELIQHHALNADVFFNSYFGESYRLQGTWALAWHILRSAIKVMKGQWTNRADETDLFWNNQAVVAWNTNRSIWTDVISICHLSLHLVTVKVYIYT